MPELPYNLTSLASVKTDMNLTGADADDILRQLIFQVSRTIENYLNRNIVRRVWTEVYSGDGTKELMLKNHPVASITSIKHDSDGDHDFSDESAIDSDTYDFDPDTGIIYADFTFTKGIRNWEVVYMAGYQDLTIITGINDKLDFNDGTSDVTATFSAGTYTGAELATETDTQMTAASSGEGGVTFTVTHSETTGKITIVASGNITLEPFEGDNVLQTVGDVLGFSRAVTHETPATTWVSDLTVWGIPGDIQGTCNKIVWLRYEKSRHGKYSAIGLKSITRYQNVPGTSITFDENAEENLLKEIYCYKEIIV